MDNSFILHLVALILAVISFLIFDGIVGNTVFLTDNVHVMTLTAIIILSVMIASSLLRSRSLTAVVMFDIIGCVLFIYTGIYYLSHKLDFGQSDSKILVEICCMLAGILLGVDAVLQIMGNSDDPDVVMEV